MLQGELWEYNGEALSAGNQARIRLCLLASHKVWMRQEWSGVVQMCLHPASQHLVSLQWISSYFQTTRKFLHPNLFLRLSQKKKSSWCSVSLSVV